MSDRNRIGWARSILRWRHYFLDPVDRCQRSVLVVSETPVASDRFTRARFLSRAMGLSLYYAAQMTLAITCGLIS